MKRIVTLLLLVVGMGLNIVPSASPALAEQAARGRTLILDVAIDARTFKLNRGLPLTEALRGDNFIVHGKIYPGETIPAGGTFESPSPFGPDAPDAIGTWVCRGTFNFDLAEIQQGAAPHVYSTQHFELDDGGVLVSDGPEGGLATLRSVGGGMGRFRGMAGEVTEEPLGVNPTGLFNYRFTFRLKK